MSVLRVTRTDTIVDVRLYRPDKANALSQQMLMEFDVLTDALMRGTGIGEGARAVVLSGEGGRAFSAGNDITSLQGLSASEATQQMLRGQEIFQRLEDCPQVTIAAIDGVALGGGLELAMACDIRVASPTSRLGQPEITLANIPGWGGTQRLPRLIGEGRAIELILTGELVDAARAEQIGLVNRVTDDPVATAHQLASAIAAKAPTAVDEALKAVYAGARHGIVHGLLVEARGVGTCCTTPEQREAVQAFLDRKKPSTPKETV
ncbi:enoyl-CoA hydratase-related protein [Agrococcus sp. ARC_14]|uniref:enoyl-CoA hydratase/isomerase family protein n=1 Tax=Agrococcus sp. ARC_14 TaxID=2919927 RepID=UPI002407C6FE|nr:enoyl-CoA hydratase-related protein [Agrococcus sp. ARC_14]